MNNRKRHDADQRGMQSGEAPNMRGTRRGGEAASDGRWMRGDAANGRDKPSDRQEGRREKRGAAGRPGSYTRTASKRKKRGGGVSLALLTLLTAIALILVVTRFGTGRDITSGFAQMFATPTPEPTPTPTPSPSPSPTPIPTPVPTPTPEPTPAPTPVKLKLPYYITVDQIAQLVRVYTVGETGEYDLMVKEMICSTGNNEKLPSGLWPLGEKLRWQVMFSGQYCQYASRITGNFLFHSVPFNKKSPSALNIKAYNKLGERDSDGCIRMQVKDVKWIYDHCPKGTPVRVMKGEPEPEAIERLKPPKLSKTDKWDPTDPDKKNPVRWTPDPDATPIPTPALGVTPKPTKLKWSKQLKRGKR